LLELALLVYLMGLVIGLRMYPRIASKVVGVAAVARRILVDRTKLGWLFPVLLLWIVERTIVSLAFQGLGLDYRWQDVEVERGILEAVLPIDNVVIPESSFLDLLVALSLLPMAIFTTMAVLGGGEQDPPKWFIGNEDDWKKMDSDDEFEALPAPGDTTEGTGTDVHEMEEDVIKKDEEGEDESFLFSDLAEQLGTLGDD
jgi:hypothetical protein